MFDELLLGLGNGSFLFIEHRRLMAIGVLYIVEDPHILQVEGFLDNLVAVDTVGTVGVVGLDAGAVVAFALDIPAAGHLEVMHLDVEAGIVGGVEQFKHEPCHIFRREPGGTQPHGDLTGGEIHRLHGFQRLGIDTEPAVGFRSLLCLPQFLSHVAGKVFVRCHIDGISLIIHFVRKLKHHPMKFFHQGYLVFSGQVGHVGNVDTGFFRQRQGQGFRCGVHPADIDLLLDGALGKHIRFADKVAVAVCNLQRGQEEIGVVRVESGVIGPLGDTAILLHKGVI